MVGRRDIELIMPKYGIKIVEYQPSYKDSILRIMASAPFKSKVWEWQFEQDRNSKSQRPLVILDALGAVIGFNGVMPLRVKYDQEVFEALWSCDFFLRKDYRGKGYGKEVKSILRESAPLIMSFGISAMASPVLLKMGWKENREVLSYRKIRRVQNIKSVAFFFLQCTNKIRHTFKVKKTSSDIRIVDQLPGEAEVNLLWNKVSSGYRKIIVRDYNYLNWKYQEHPQCDYQYICVYQSCELQSVSIIRRGHDYAQLVDYLGESADIQHKISVVDAFCKYYKDAPILKCVTSDKGIQRALEANAFYREKHHPKFYIYSNLVDDDGLGDWFLMGGDSDADFLQASVDSDRENLPYDICVEAIDHNCFVSMEEDWQNLLNHSDANPLFMSWSWQTTWWKIWGNEFGGELRLYTARSADGELLGLAPLYASRMKAGKTRVQFIGQHWGSKNNIRSEYLEFIVSSRRAKAINHALIKHVLKDIQWHQLLLCDTPTNSVMQDYLTRKYFYNCYIRSLSEDIGIVLNCNGVFTDYLATLGRNTRHKIRNRRNYIEKNYSVDFCLAEKDEINEYFDELNELHHIRWSCPCFENKSLSFHKSIAKDMSEHGLVKFSRLIVDGKTVSINYDLCAGSTEYNIQSSFNQEFCKSVSLGTLHFGYSLEKAFLNHTTTRYDFLAGNGKEQFYKDRFGGEAVRFSTIQIIRDPPMILLYWFYDKLPLVLRNILRSQLMK